MAPSSAGAWRGWPAHACSQRQSWGTFLTHAEKRAAGPAALQAFGSSWLLLLLGHLGLSFTPRRPLLGSSVCAGRAVCCLEVGRACKEAAGRCQQQVEAELGVRRWRGLDTGVQLCPERIFADPLGLSCPMSIRAQSQSALAASAVLMVPKRKWGQCKRVKYWHTD